MESAQNEMQELAKHLNIPNVASKNSMIGVNPNSVSDFFKQPSMGAQRRSQMNLNQGNKMPSFYNTTSVGGGLPGVSADKSPNKGTNYLAGMNQMALNSFIQGNALIPQNSLLAGAQAHN